MQLRDVPSGKSERGLTHAEAALLLIIASIVFWVLIAWAVWTVFRP
jgi:hypothetical protein